MKNKIEGCLLGSLLGDCLGAPYESGFLERLYWVFYGKTPEGLMRYTDDTEMSIALAEYALWNNDSEFNQDALACYFLESMSPHRGYGKRSIKGLKKAVKKQFWNDEKKEISSNINYWDGSIGNDSFGNGSSMRSHIMPLLYSDFNEVMKFTEMQSVITHSHYQAVICSKFIAATVHMALQDADSSDIIKALDKLYNQTMHLDILLDVLLKLTELQTSLYLDKTFSMSSAQKLGSKPIAIYSVFTAIYFALMFKDRDFFEMIDSINSLGGDTDTVGSMAGAIWGAFNGSDSFNNSDAIYKVEGVQEIRVLANEIFAARK